MLHRLLFFKTDALVSCSRRQRIRFLEYVLAAVSLFLNMAERHGVESVFTRVYTRVRGSARFMNIARRRRCKPFICSAYTPGTHTEHGSKHLV